MEGIQHLRRSFRRRWRPRRGRHKIKSRYHDAWRQSNAHVATSWRYGHVPGISLRDGISALPYARFQPSLSKRTIDFRDGELQDVAALDGSASDKSSRGSESGTRERSVQLRTISCWAHWHVHWHWLASLHQDARRLCPEVQQFCWVGSNYSELAFWNQLTMK